LLAFHFRTVTSGSFCLRTVEIRVEKNVQNLKQGMKKSGMFKYIRIVSFRTVSCWHLRSRSQIHWGDKVDFRIGLSYRPARLHRLADLYDNTMPESTISPIQSLMNLATGHEIFTVLWAFQNIRPPKTNRCRYQSLNLRLQENRARIYRPSFRENWVYKFGPGFRIRIRMDPH
jgi:hypothetical protein